MKFTKRIWIALLSVCMTLALALFVVACNNTTEPDTPQTPGTPGTPGTPETPGTGETYSVTYAFGSCNETAYGGDDDLPTETKKEEGAKFKLAAALVWDGYTFKGWNDTETTYDAGAEYEMPGHAVTLTAQWEEDKAPAPT